MVAIVTHHWNFDMSRSQKRRLQVAIICKHGEGRRQTVRAFKGKTGGGATAMGSPDLELVDYGAPRHVWSGGERRVWRSRER